MIMVVTVIFCTKSFTKSLPRVRRYERESNYATPWYTRKESEVMVSGIAFGKNEFKTWKTGGIFQTDMRIQQHEEMKRPEFFHILP